jgi:hypothetical protein
LGEAGLWTRGQSRRRLTSAGAASSLRVRTFKDHRLSFAPALHGPLSDKLGPSRASSSAPPRRTLRSPRPQRNDSYDPYSTYASPQQATNGPKDAFSSAAQHTQSVPSAPTHALVVADAPPRQPIVTGTSVLALKYKDGVMMAADNLGLFLPTPSHRAWSSLTCLASVVRVPGPLQGHTATPPNRQVYRYRCWR